MTLKKKKRTVRRRTWNKGLEVGQKDAFTPAQVRQIRRVLTNRGAAGARDLSLFSLAIDTMLQGPELLNLTFKDVAHADGRIRSIIEIARSRRKPPVRCALSKATATALAKWIAASGMKRGDLIFPGRGGRRPRAMSARQMNRLLKIWVAEAGLDPENYGKESLATWRRCGCSWVTRRSNPRPTICASPRSRTLSQYRVRSKSEARGRGGIG
jgi:integrase